MEITRLVKRAKRKDADAFTELMESQMQNMYKVARSILSRDEDVADAISDTILVCWEKIDTLKKNRFFRTWMTRILINKCNDILRAGQRTVFTDEPLEIEYMENEFLNLEWILKGSDESRYKQRVWKHRCKTCQCRNFCIRFGTHFRLSKRL